MKKYRRYSSVSFTAGDKMKNIIRSIIVTICSLLILSTTVFSDSMYDENNRLMYYSEPYVGAELMTIPMVSKQDALLIAKNFIAEKCPEIADSINTDNASISHSKSYPYGYNITFPRIINNIEYEENYVSLFIDSKNGQVNTYTKNFSTDIITEDSSSVIDKGSAENIYKSAFGIHLQYNKKIAGNKIYTYLTYTADDFMVNAITGNTIVTPYYIPTDSYFDIINTAEKVSEYVDDGSSISISDANDIIRNIPELGISDDYRIVSVDYLKNHDDTHLINLLFKNGNYTKEVALNAKTGLLVEYTDNSADIVSPLNPDMESVAESFAEKYYGDYSNQFIKRKNSEDNYTVLLYERHVNDIPYKSNGLYVSYYNGKLKKVSFAWDNTEFMPTDNIVSEEYAYKQFFEKCGLELIYFKRDNGILTPVYKKSSNGTGIIDAESGRQLNYDGSFYYTPKEMKYLDTDTHYAGKIASILSDCDIYASSGNVYLEDYITQEEYLLLISEFINGTKPILNTTGILTDDQREMLYAYMYSNGIIDRSEADYTAFVTRADAVKYLLRILGHGTVGEMSDIFITHFEDADTIPENLVGYVELARSLGYINGSTNNCFKPNEFLTNGDSLIIIYNYLSKQG